MSNTASYRFHAPCRVGAPAAPLPAARVIGNCRSLLLALAFDAAFGELPSALHPVVAMGRWLALGERLAPTRARGRLVWGAAWVLSGMSLSAFLARLVPRHPLVQGATASTLLAYRALDRAVGEVECTLVAGDLAAARRLLGWHLVSRPTAELNAAEVAAAAIESLAENLSDSLVAPLLWFALGGLPALAAYRFGNTADAMWGYHTPRYEHLGKAAARCDDLLNWLPARLTALAIALSAQLLLGQGATAWRVARRDHALTPSPNAGWPMAAMAGALDTTLSKVGCYRLGAGSREPGPPLIDEARRITRGVVLGIVALAAAGSAAGSGRKEDR
jgi:adenosylcobinamide-phosphate synthase